MPFLNSSPTYSQNAVYITNVVHIEKVFLISNLGGTMVGQCGEIPG